MREARDDVLEAPVVVCSVRMVLLWAIHALYGSVVKSRVGGWGRQ